MKIKIFSELHTNDSYNVEAKMNEFIEANPDIIIDSINPTANEYAFWVVLQYHLISDRGDFN